MDGGTSGNTGVSLLSGSGIVVGDSITLISGARQWRIRVPSSKESEDNIVVVEYRSGARWIIAQTYVLPVT